MELLWNSIPSTIANAIIKLKDDLEGWTAFEHHMSKKKVIIQLHPEQSIHFSDGFLKILLPPSYSRSDISSLGEDLSRAVENLWVSYSYLGKNVQVPLGIRRKLLAKEERFQQHQEDLRSHLRIDFDIETLLGVVMETHQHTYAPYLFDFDVSIWETLIRSTREDLSNELAESLLNARWDFTIDSTIDHPLPSLERSFLFWKVPNFIPNRVKADGEFSIEAFVCGVLEKVQFSRFADCLLDHYPRALLTAFRFIEDESTSYLASLLEKVSNGKVILKIVDGLSQDHSFVLQNENLELQIHPKCFATLHIDYRHSLLEFAREIHRQSQGVVLQIAEIWVGDFFSLSRKSKGFAIEMNLPSGEKYQVRRTFSQLKMFHAQTSSKLKDQMPSIPQTGRSATIKGLQTYFDRLKLLSSQNDISEIFSFTDPTFGATEGNWMDPDKEGWMKKQGHVVKNWKMR